MKTALVLQHLAFEDLGLLGPVLTRRGYRSQVCEIGRDGLTGLDVQQPDLMIVLGGPVGAYESDRYPWLAAEKAWIQARLATGRPLLGICLGAQLIAEVAGGRVFPGHRKEIGWSPLHLTAAGCNSPLAALGDQPVLHWHGDTYLPPPEAVHLARSEAFEQQAFQLGSNVLALQFHLEVRPDNIERWLIGHAAELAATGTDLDALRYGARTAGDALAPLVEAVFAAWSGGWTSG